MAALRLQETPQAQADLDAIEDFLAARDPDAARRVIAAVADTYQSILDWPKLGNLLPYKGVRMRLVLGFYSNANGRIRCNIWNHFVPRLQSWSNCYCF